MNGWTSISYNGDSLALTGSAFDADGGPMIVGGGAALISESSAALLLLVGGALLALRRRRCYHVQRVGKQDLTRSCVKF